MNQSKCLHLLMAHYLFGTDGQAQGSILTIIISDQKGKTKHFEISNQYCILCTFVLTPLRLKMLFYFSVLDTESKN